MKLNTNEVEQLCYKSKRGIQTNAEIKRFFKLQEIFSGNEDFERARILGQARAMAEVNPSLGVEYWVKELSKPIKIVWEEISTPTENEKP